MKDTAKNQWKGRLLLIIAAAVIVSLVYMGMLKVRQSGSSTKYHIILIPKVVDEENDFWKALLEGAAVAAKENGIELDLRAPDAENNHEMQSEILRQAAADKPDAVILTPTSYTEVTEAAKQVTDAGIPLILVDSTLDENIQSALIATDNIEAGKKIAECLKNVMPQEPVIGIVAHVQGSSTAIEREQGFRLGVKEYEDKIVGTVFSDSDYERSYEVTLQLLKENPAVNVLVGLNEYSAVGAARAVVDARLTHEIEMVGFDSSVEEIRLLESGVFSGIVVQKPFNMGYLSVETAVSILQGKKVEAMVDSGSQAVLKDTMYTEENQKLLFMFRENQN